MNSLPSPEVALLRADAEALHAGGAFKADALASYSAGKGDAKFDPAHDRMVMPSFFPSTGKDGPFVDYARVGDGVARRRFATRIGSLRNELATKLEGRPTLAADAPRTHEMSYTRYGPGAFLPRHTDEHHAELKKAHPVASGDEHLKVAAAPSSGAPAAVPSRRSVTWLVYLNDDWNVGSDGGELRVHERGAPPAHHVGFGARSADLQIGWLRATATEREQPVFLDASRPSPQGNCALYCYVDGDDAPASDATAPAARVRDVSRPFNANPALYLAGGDVFARKLLVDDPADARRFHLIDAPKSAASAFLPTPGERGEDGGERVRDIAPMGGTLVLFRWHTRAAVDSYS